MNEIESREMIDDMAREMCQDESRRRHMKSCYRREITCISLQVYGGLARRLYQIVQEQADD